MKVSLIIVFIISSFVSYECNATSFEWIDSKGRHMELVHGKRKIARYVYQKMDPSNRELTYKPFHHIYQNDNNVFLTKGAGGKFSHHRGIFFGFSKCRIFKNDTELANVDTWHCKRAYQVHEKIVEKKVNKNLASHTSEISWRLDDGIVFITEKRTLSFSLMSDSSIKVDFKSLLSTDFEKVTLDGDPQHAGFQFRASNEIAQNNSNQTYYTRPVDGKGLPGQTKNWPKNKDMKNLLWKAQTVFLNDSSYTTLYLDHPENPKPSFYSERDYGRFGSFFKSQVTPNNELTIRYRLIIGKNERTPTECKQFSTEFISSI